jgi:hypothetical protein
VKQLKGRVVDKYIDEEIEEFFAKEKRAHVDCSSCVEPSEEFKLKEDEDHYGCYVRVGENLYLTANHVLEDTMFDHDGRDMSALLEIDGEEHEITLAYRRANVDLIAFEMCYTPQMPIYPIRRMTGTVPVELPLATGRVLRTLIQLDENYWVCENCPLVPGCSGLPALHKGQTVAIFVGMQEDKRGIFVNAPDIMPRLAIVANHMKGVQLCGKGRNKKRFHRYGAKSADDYDGAVEILRESLGRDPKSWEISNYFDSAFYDAVYEDNYESNNPFDDYEFSAEEGYFLDNDRADFEREGRDAYYGRGGSSKYFVGYTKELVVFKGDKVVPRFDMSYIPYSKKTSAKDEDDEFLAEMEALVSKAAGLVVQPAPKSNPFDAVSDAELENLINKNSKNPFADTVNPFDREPQAPLPAMMPVATLSPPSAVKTYLGALASKPGAPVKFQIPSAKDISKLRMEHECEELQAQIDAIQGTGIFLREVVALSPLEEAKFPPNEHMKHLLLKKLKMLTDKQRYLERKRIERESANKTLQRTQDLFDAKVRELANLKIKLEELKKASTDTDVDF